MTAMGVVAVHLDRHLLAELLPAGTAVDALGAALVVMHHHARADPRLAFGHAGADRGDDPAGLMAGDGRIGIDGEPDAAAAVARPAVLMQVGAAHARCLHLDHHLAGAGRGVGKFHERELTVAGEHDAAHLTFLRCGAEPSAASIL